MWEFGNSGWVRVQQRDWNRPVCDEWVNVLEQAVGEIGESPVLVAHSLGSLCVAHWVARNSLNIKEALLVAPPPNLEKADFPLELTGFSPVSLCVYERVGVV
ncbi:MAG: hypothetical protein NPIRA06_22810 [Nitrospirales bacterium]|nr:MAG: hypothetical protein NPIRA06_22810 [Nitrospirales bacterium]